MHRHIHRPSEYRKELGMENLTLDNVTQILTIAASTAIENEQYFCELDSAAGDGDFGATLAKGFKVLQGDLKRKEDYPDISALLRHCGMVMMEHCGGATGSLWGKGFITAGKRAKGQKKLDLSHGADLVKAFTEGMQKVGGAVKGDKTIVDALLAAVESLESAVASGEKDFSAAMKSTVEAVKDGADKTKDMVAKKGRASYLGERSLGHPDAGATALAVIFRNLSEKFFNPN